MVGTIVQQQQLVAIRKGSELEQNQKQAMVFCACVAECVCIGGGLSQVYLS